VTPSPGTGFTAQHELSEDPHDFLSSYILHSTQHLAAGSLVFAALYLLSHGIVKIVLVWEILHDRLWAYLALSISPSDSWFLRSTDSATPTRSAFFS
jgi:uncharacterized membrane protein